jgi:hypothetical protein
MHYNLHFAVVLFTSIDTAVLASAAMVMYSLAAFDSLSDKVSRELKKTSKFAAVATVFVAYLTGVAFFASF